MAPQDIPYADYAGYQPSAHPFRGSQSELNVTLRIGPLLRAHVRHFHRRMLQVTLSLVDVILFHGVMTAVLMCVAVKYRGVIENW